jgi:hypothetical protein
MTREEFLRKAEKQFESGSYAHFEWAYDTLMQAPPASDEELRRKIRRGRGDPSGGNDEAGMKPKRSEADVLQQVMRLLRGRSVAFVRRNVGGARNAGQYFSWGVRGEADIEAWPRCRIDGWANVPHTLWLELKSSTGKQSPAQAAFQRMVESLGHTYLICHSADEVNRWLDEHLA